MNIADAVVLVTGANRGLGREIVLASLKAGARKVYAGAREPQQLAALVRESEGRVVPLTIDVTREVTLAAAAEVATDVTLLFNNAGVVASQQVLSSSVQALQQDFATNVFGVLSTTKAFLPALEKNGRDASAAIVNILSVVSLSSMPALGGYSASKAAAHSVTQALRSELSTRRVQVHGVFAGAIDTDMTRDMKNMPKASPVDVARAILQGVERGVEDIFPDAMSAGAFETWRRDPKELERQLASLTG
ncbi:MAG: short-chain dehydrogenase/reductase [Polyangiaceae bacterium]|jgi:NAD(P)-dependent dehydrogenase (short-subunit alcohol dehydrogenase family)|nr:short-chain dehydrogenase/reductase [Polyangiaceae bacterium]